ncbi:MAG: class I tRNA ligase family protein [Acidobacteria bacterium]|nr:class I tRNA ligase family protein [Acidobacteriota bacterium]
MRVWGLVNDNLDLFAEAPAVPGGGEPGAALVKKTHQTIRKVTDDIGVRFHLNTAISSIMELYNQARKDRDALRGSPEGRAALRLALESIVRMLSPFAPHMAEELWERTGHQGLLMLSNWPVFDPALAREETIPIVVQINGKVRDRFEAAADTPEAELQAAALALPKVQAALGGQLPRKVVAIRNKLVSIVV